MSSRFVFYDTSALIKDYFFYADHEEEIDDWLYENDCQRTGMVIQFNNAKAKTLFMLRWS
jgi:hypothetical protein